MAKQINTQSIFLNKVRLDGTKVTIFLANKLRLTGVIVGYDEYSIVLESDNSQLLIYKSNIASIAPSGHFRAIKNVK